tara:strand:- start:73607 stop:74176 length:570 start_codon:yes stop_codon:yes gene_type:complete
MTITEFNISTDKTKLELTITDAASVVSLLLWKDTNYKDFTKAIDLSSKLTDSATESIEITLSDLGETFFDGVYFIEAEDDTDLSLQYTYDLTRYKECIIDRILELSNFSGCDECLQTNSVPLINAHSILKGLNYALEQRFINEILEFTKTLNKYCKDDCKNCGVNIIDNDSQDVLNPDNITITLDGGDI